MFRYMYIASFIISISYRIEYKVLRVTFKKIGWELEQSINWTISIGVMTPIEKKSKAYI